MPRHQMSYFIGHNAVTLLYLPQNRLLWVTFCLFYVYTHKSYTIYWRRSNDFLVDFGTYILNYIANKLSFRIGLLTLRKRECIHLTSSSSNKSYNKQVVKIRRIKRGSDNFLLDKTLNDHVRWKLGIGYCFMKFLKKINLITKDKYLISRSNRKPLQTDPKPFLWSGEVWKYLMI